MDPLLIKQLASQLHEEKSRLEKALAAFAIKDSKMRGDWDTVFPASSSLAAPMSHTSQEEQADLREEFEAELAQEHSLESRLLEVDRALERIQNNTFGVCRGCGHAISEERLRANPAAEYDIKHQPKD